MNSLSRVSTVVATILLTSVPCSVSQFLGRRRQCCGPIPNRIRNAKRLNMLSPNRNSICKLGTFSAASLLLFPALPVFSETALDRVLSYIGTVSEAADFDLILTNMTENSTRVVDGAYFTNVDGSVTVLVYSPKAEFSSTVVNGGQLSDDKLLDVESFDFGIKTSGIAASNQGAIKMIFDHETSPSVENTRRVLSANAARNTGDVLSSIRFIATPATGENTGSFATTAIGASNVGSIEITIRSESKD